jgi:mRNA interferase MazF
MEKDFDKWNEKKKSIHTRKKQVLFNEREVWWCSLGVNVGFEMDGKNELFERPVLVLRKFSKLSLLVLPLTSREKEGKYYYTLPEHKGITSRVILSQFRLISSKRLIRKVRKIPSTNHNEIRRKVKELL